MLKTRILSAVLMALLLLAILFGLPPIATYLLIGLVVALGAWEWTALLPLTSRLMRTAGVFVILALLTLAWRYAAQPPQLQLLLWVAALWWTLAFLWILLAPQRVSRPAAASAAVLALVPAGVALLYLRMLPANGAAWLLLALAVIAAADVGAFFAGRAFGRVKLAPRVSPGKSWEGVLGGMVLAMLIGALGAKWLGGARNLAMLAALMAASFSVVGDLTESMLKRHAGVKDSGTVLPGHGGVLDRVDGICAGVPVLLLCWLQFGLLP